MLSRERNGSAGLDEEQPLRRPPANLLTAHKLRQDSMSGPVTCRIIAPPVTKTKILIVDDEEAIREVVAALLEAQGYECAAVGNGRLAQEYLGNHAADLVLDR